MTGRLHLVPLPFSEAAAFVREHHRHHTPPAGAKFCLGACLAGALVGVVIVGRPVSRMRDDGKTLEVTRLTTDGTKNACSFLYGAAARATFALGYERLGTYILKTEPGTSLKAAGWKLIGERSGGKSWNTAQQPQWRRRGQRHDVSISLQPKLLWEAVP